MPSTADSAGIQIVTNGPKPSGGTGWTVGQTPTFDVGGGDKGPDYELTQVVGAARLGDGRVAVANASSAQIRFYRADGTFETAVGRAGEGPGEFRMLGGLWLGRGDSLLVPDVQLQRLTAFDGSGAFGRSFALGGRSGVQIGQSGVRLALPQAWLADGSVVGAEQEFRLNSQAEGSYRDTVAVLRFGAEGEVLDTVGRFPGIEMRQTTLTFGGRTIPTPSPVPLGRNTVVGGRGDRVFVATNEGWELREIGPGGELERLIRIAEPPVELTEADIAANRAEQLELLEGFPQFRSVPAEIKEQMLKSLQEAEYPKTLTWVAGILPGPDQTVWVREVVRPGDRPGRMAVFDAGGVLVARIEIPARFQVFQVGASELLGVWRDPDGVEHVRAYPLSR
ncbi:MAG: hypothetical protein R2909_08940 [Gemmatimonadales bacterium]